MGLFWVSLKRDKVTADIYYKGEKVCTISVSDNNRGNTSVINFTGDSDVIYKINKTVEPIAIDENAYNKEEFNV